MKYLCSVSFGLHYIDIDAHDFNKWAKKEEENNTIKFLSLLIDDYEKSLSFLSEACNGIKSVYGSVKIHEASPFAQNIFWVRNTSCFFQNCFRTSLKPETECNGLRMVRDLQRKRNLSILSSSEKAVEILESAANIVPDASDHVAAGYDRKVCIDKVVEIDDCDTKNFIL